MIQDSKHASRGNSFEIENLIKVCDYLSKLYGPKKLCLIL